MDCPRCRNEMSVVGWAHHLCPVCKYAVVDNGAKAAVDKLAMEAAVNIARLVELAHMSSDSANDCGG